MKISALIDTDYKSIDIEEEVFEVSERLKEVSYLVPIDQNMQAVGIITIDDIHKHPYGKIIDCDITKPNTKPDDTLIHVMEMMKKDNLHYLPVFDQYKFVGVISLTMISQRLAEHVKNAQILYQKVIHDVRNPITNIKGLTQIMIESKSDEGNQEILQMFDVSCQQAINILDDLLYIENDNKGTLKEIELNAFYKRCIAEQRGLAKLKNVEITESYAIEKVIKKIDEEELKRAVQNIISNAIKFSFPFGKIKVSTKYDGGNLILKITDAGIGIPSNLQPYIFHKFTVAKRAGTNGEMSTGLGLFFAKQTINSHRGTIYFKSTHGKGTKFYITL